MSGFHTHQSRRRFIKQTLATTGTFGLATTSAQVESGPRTPIDPAALDKLQERLKGSLTRPTEPGYDVSFVGTLQQKEAGRCCEMRAY